jgi:hypothetical protein
MGEIVGAIFRKVAYQILRSSSRGVGRYLTGRESASVRRMPGTPAGGGGRATGVADIHNPLSRKRFLDSWPWSMVADAVSGHFWICNGVVSSLGNPQKYVSAFRKMEWRKSPCYTFLCPNPYGLDRP